MTYENIFSFIEIRILAKVGEVELSIVANFTSHKDYFHDKNASRTALMLFSVAF